MRSIKGLVAVMAIICALGTSAMALSQSTTTKVEDPLGSGLSWMDISSPEHTSEYLQKTGLATGSATGYTSYDLRGNWTFELKTLDQKPVGNMDIHLTQVGTIVFGSGTIPSSGQEVTANGAIVENTLSLNLVTLPNANLYQTKMSITDNSTSGDFTAYSGTSDSYLEGTVTGYKDVPRTLS